MSHEHPQHRHPDAVPPMHELGRFSLLAHATTEEQFRMLARPPLQYSEPIFATEPTEEPDPAPNQDPRAAEVYWQNFNALDLTPRQRLIFPYVSHGFTNPEIVEELQDAVPGLTKGDVANDLRSFWVTQTYSSRTRFTSRLVGLADEPPEVIPEPLGNHDYQVEYELAKRLEKFTMDEEEYLAVNLILRGWTRKETMLRTRTSLSFVRTSVRQVGKPLGTTRASGILSRLLKFSYTLPQFPSL